MKVSVVIPLYNASAFVLDTLLSVYTQTYKDYEVIIVNDGSTDNGPDLVSEFIEDKPNWKMITQVNRGLAGARNTGILTAQGEYIAFIDSDDLWHTQKLEKHVKHLDSNPKIGLSFSRSEFVDIKGVNLGIYQMPILFAIKVEDILLRNPVGNGSAPVMRKSALENIAYFPEVSALSMGRLWYFDEHFRRAEDIECWLRLAIQTDWLIEGIPEALTYYRLNEAGLSADVSKQQQALEHVIAKLYSYAPSIANEFSQPAFSYQYRYLSRRAVRSRDADNAVKYITKALRIYPKIVLEEPRRTIMTLVASYIMLFLPGSLYLAIEAIMFRITGSMQKRVIEKETIQSS